jgi:hypothetical protein
VLVFRELQSAALLALMAPKEKQDNSQYECGTSKAAYNAADHLRCLKRGAAARCAGSGAYQNR